jgi:hypothetical protein
MHPIATVTTLVYLTFPATPLPSFPGPCMGVFARRALAPGEIACGMDGSLVDLIDIIRDPQPYIHDPRIEGSFGRVLVPRYDPAGDVGQFIRDVVFDARTFDHLSSQALRKEATRLAEESRNRSNVVIDGTRFVVTKPIKKDEELRRAVNRMDIAILLYIHSPNPLTRHRAFQWIAEEFKITL